MKRKTDLNRLLGMLRAEKVETWFDLGLFIDRFKEQNDLLDRGFSMSPGGFRNKMMQGGIGFVTFHYMVDGVTVEIGKYARLFASNYPGIPIHYIGGRFRNKSDKMISSHYRKHMIPELAGFDEWNLYRDFFHTDLERGSEKYNRLILQLWEQTLIIVEKLGKYIESEEIKILYPVNICSNPGNVSAALAMVLLSEFLEIPVINNNHDFYFEGGHSRFDRRSKELKKGPRDFFYSNAHLGEIFSIIEMIYPWESKLWMNVNINRSQSEHLIRYKGHNPARVTEIGTAVDTGIYTKNDKRRNINAILQLEHILSRYQKQLVSYSVDDVEKGGLVSENKPAPILVGSKTGPVEKFSAENIIFLQPTRIISRKRIELGFSLLQKLFDNKEMRNRFTSTSNLKITLLISGPIASGHYIYFKKLISKFRKLISELPGEFRSRVFLALLFGEIDTQSFLDQYEEPLCIPDLYNIASLILLPSKTEGRGLPIIESTACGTPIFCRRYDPEAAYSEVIGEHLGDTDRLRVYEFRAKKINKQVVANIIERVFFPHHYAEETRHNIRCVQQRYSLEALGRNIKVILEKLHSQLQPETYEISEVSRAFEDYRYIMSKDKEELGYLLHDTHRHYLPGYGRLAYMLFLKSLIDPSYFRIEQQRVKGSIFYFAREILNNDPDFERIPEEKTEQFYHSVNRIFHIVEGRQDILHDHSMSYRHRNRNHYPYQQYTFQELTGIVNLLYLRIVQPAPNVKVNLSPQFFTDWNLALLQLSSSNFLAIDNRQQLIAKLKENLPIAYFPGEFIMYELEFFALQAIRSRLELTIEQELTQEILEMRHQEIAPVYIFAQENKLGKQLNRKEIENYIVHGQSEELRLLYAYRLIKIVQTQQLCVGIHFQQLGKKAISMLNEITSAGGFLLTNRRHAALMTDFVNIDRFHIGRVRGEIAANIMGIPEGAGYIQFVPAGIRATIAYPTPVQTAWDLDNVLHGDLHAQLQKSLGKEYLEEKIRTETEKNGTPLIRILEKIRDSEAQAEEVNHKQISGKYADGNPYNGAFALINPVKDSWNFNVVSTGGVPQTVSAFVQDFEQETGQVAGIAWNGGYILNHELVGKLGLPESYIGSPLGLLIREGSCLSPPLFNKAALIIDEQGTMEIRRVNCREGICMKAKGSGIYFSKEHYNAKEPDEESPAFYDLLYDGKIQGDGRVVIRFSGSIVKEILRTRKGESVDLIPVGLTISLPAGQCPAELSVGDKVDFTIAGMEKVRHAIEAGPLLLKDGKPCIDMEAEGWKTAHSIMTQAARLDYLDMRGPKIAAGMNEKGEFLVLTINGRIRESVGATHTDMANILAEHGMISAMGFDPGGSSTLYANGKNLNISPYNSNYEYNIYALPPESRAVSNAIIGFINK